MDDFLKYLRIGQKGRAAKSLTSLLRASPAKKNFKGQTASKTTRKKERANLKHYVRVNLKYTCYGHEVIASPTFCIKNGVFFLHGHYVFKSYFLRGMSCIRNSTIKSTVWVEV